VAGPTDGTAGGDPAGGFPEAGGAAPPEPDAAGAAPDGAADEGAREGPKVHWPCEPLCAVEQAPTITIVNVSRQPATSMWGREARCM
jgi:hypothetical protein